MSTEDFGAFDYRKYPTYQPLKKDESPVAGCGLSRGTTVVQR